MYATNSPIGQTEPRRLIRTTLLDVVAAVSEAADNDQEVVAVIHHLLSSGRMRLAGEFTEKDFIAALE